MSEYNNGCAINTRMPRWMYDQIKQRAKALDDDGSPAGMGKLIRESLIQSGLVKVPASGKKKAK